ncbi:MAG: metal ABC transporter substrate-binding protein [Candidatus Latescibacterota bacterium]|jgi:zinc/manganese transport system substrate-binding protein
MVIHRYRCTLVSLLLMVAAGPTAASAPLRVVASINDLASIAAEVGGERVKVQSVARPNSDVHRVEVLPSYMVRVSRADLYLKVGLGLDTWADQIVDGSRSDHLVVLDCARDITPLERPTGKVDASMGDVHPEGNPHYWLDPRNGAIVAREIAETLSELDPQGAELFRQRSAGLARSADSLRTAWIARIALTPTPAIFTYHSSWVYLGHAFGLEIASNVEPVPGIPPTASHLQKLIGIARERRVSVLVQEPYFSDEAGQFLTREAGVRVVKASASCDEPMAGSWLQHLDEVMAEIAGSER